MTDTPVLKPCGHCGEQCADLIIDQGDKWAHYSASCLEVRTGYNLSSDAPWRDEAIAAYNKRQPTQSDALQAENEQLRHDLERQMTIANEQVNQAERLRDALEAAPIISLWESKEDFRRRQDGWLKTKYRAALERSE